MEFDSLDERYRFDNNYALAARFGSQEHSSRKSIDGEYWLRKEFVCCKQGKKRDEVFNERHNHPMSSVSDLFRSHRRVSKAKKAMIEQCAKANISISKQVALLEVQSGGIGNIGCIPKDIYNVEQQL
ncbi:uncharacterized protein LOC125480526 [Pyrus x bretschneideri]|uniref:uncharacterized protein LOC125480526 n=1 Tax=Pyrus x bretschneideri TaxID=225117 RepID=UPI00202F9640|nr:uncharacterized protein LOC125480526 [Pyrus x bretschneideri]